ncbi:MAG: FAD-binding oxidoreductase [Gammaproteobacteria bacterium]|nr:FAD-binding oxidoreductase [Gammaproteobacteria bacterium]
MHLSDYDTRQRYTAVVKQTTRITAQESSEEVDELILEIDDPSFIFSIGQTIGVLVPGPHEAGHEFHFRLYNIASSPIAGENGKPQIELCVKRCFYIDDYSGEKYPGIASNYLCDLQAGDKLTISGPYGIAFEIPEDRNANILMLGMGTGIAPFRAFIQHIYQTAGAWKGKVWLFYGAHTGLEMLYMNDKRNVFAKYYNEETFQAFKAISSRPHWGESIALDQALEEKEAEVWEMICCHNTYVYVAGHERILTKLDKALSKMAGSRDKWQRRQAELVAGKRWMEIIY